MPWAAPKHRHVGYRTPEQRKQEVDKQRGSRSQRGYGRDWIALRLEFLAQHPYCECDEHQGKDGRVLAQVVDHRLSIQERPDLRLEWSNLRAMSKACHDRHTATTQGFAQGSQRGARR